jgi:TPR repeat protein
MAKTPLTVVNFTIFVSYSRTDETFTNELKLGLEDKGHMVQIDNTAIRHGVEWKASIRKLIVDCDTIVFVLSPDSVRSDICQWEIEVAERAAKRIIPVLHRGLSELPRGVRNDGSAWPPGHVDAPRQLARLNYVRFDEGRSFILGLRNLQQALEDDHEWIEAHSRLAARARIWKEGNNRDQANRDLLLMSGDDIAAASRLIETRKAGAPPILSEHLEYIKASKAHKDVTAARTARVKTVALFAVSVVATALTFLSWQVWQQRNLAVSQRVVAGDALKYISEVFLDNYRQMDSIALQRAFEIFRQGADGGNATAMNFLALQYADGSGGIRDPRAAVEWWQRAVDLGEIDALYHLGWYYAYGNGIQHDPKKAHDTLERAAERDSSAAMRALGGLYFSGYGVEKNFDTARKWWDLAAGKGDVKSMIYIGSSYLDAHNKDEATKWIEMAEKKGQREAFEYSGYAWFKAQEYRLAAGDLRNAIRLKGGAYPILFHFLARAHLNELGAAKQDLREDADQIPRASWPTPVITLMLDDKEPELVIQKGVAEKQACEADFYVGEWYLLKDQRDRARQLFLAASGEDCRGLIEHGAAIAELDRLPK